MEGTEKIVVCPKCGQEFKTLLFLSISDEDCDLDGRLRGVFRPYSTKDYCECEECGCVFYSGAESQPLSLDDENYNFDNSC